MSSIGSPSTFFLAKKKAYEVQRSLRFNDNDTPYLSRTPSGDGNRKTFTISFWVKRANLSGTSYLYSVGTSSTNYFHSRMHSNGKIQFNSNVGGTVFLFTTDRLFRDPANWYHIVFSLDSTQATASDRVKIYVNGQQETSFSTETYPSQNTDFLANSTSTVYFGRRGYSASEYLDGYLAEFNFLDGYAYDPSYFGETNSTTGQWNPKKYTGGYGSNGFYLNFSDNSGTTATTLGKDSSGNGNNFTPNNFNTHDSLIDTPTNNFCILNSIFNHHNRGEVVLYEGNLKCDNGGGGDDLCHGTFGIKSGKWYFEATGSSVQSQSHFVGVQTSDAPEIQGGLYRNNGYIVNYSGTLTTGNGTYDSGDVMGVAIDADAGKVYFAKNNTYINSGNPSTGANASFTYTPSSTDHILPALMFDNISHTCIWYINFGQDSSFAGFKTAQGNTDSGGKGDFYYAPPSGFLALCSANLPEPTILSPNKHFDTLLYTGNGSTQSISGLNFQPDWVWIKQRNAAENHFLTDSNRGAGLHLRSDQGTAESDDSATFTAFTSDGFSLTGTGASANQVNDNSDTYVAWNWNGGDTDGKTYTVTVVSDSGNKYRFDGFGTSAVTLDLAEGGTYIFNYPSAHPFRFSTTSDGTHGGGSEYTTGVTVISSTSIQIVVAASAPTLYYYCSSHSGMGGQINTNSTLGSSNFDGNLQSVTKVNATSGFSIVKWTSGANAYKTVGHGLGVKPDIVILKARTTSNNWFAYTDVIDGTNDFLELNSTNAAADAESYSIVPPTSTVFGTDGAFISGSSNIQMIAYVFSSVEGYSKIGKYTGNASTDGTFVFCGFKPSVIILKKTSSTDNWTLFDIKRDIDNPMHRRLRANIADAEVTTLSNSQDQIDFLSNGFKMRSTSNNHNGSGATNIYLAFAESPFKNARAR